MKANVQNVALRGAQRIIAISDVHGNGHLLQRLLEQIGFSAKERLCCSETISKRGAAAFIRCVL